MLFFLIHRRGGYFGVLGAVFDRRVAAAHVPFALEGGVLKGGAVLMVNGGRCIGFVVLVAALLVDF